MILKYPVSANLNWTKEHLMQILCGGSKPLIVDPLIINAFNQINRKDFVPENLRYLSYNDISIEIGNNVVLNKPTTIGEMLTCLKPKFGGKYLVLGTATGYEALLLSVITGETGKVYSLESVQWIHTFARKNLLEYPKIRNVEMLIRDPHKGLIEKAPYDGILMTKVGEDVEQKVLEQLTVNSGRLVLLRKDYNVSIIERKSADIFEEEIVDIISM